MAYANSNRILTIASFGGNYNSGVINVSNVTIVSETAPQYRDNGGDLVNGDRWYMPSCALEYLWDGQWLPIRANASHCNDGGGGGSLPHPHPHPHPPIWPCPPHDGTWPPVVPPTPHPDQPPIWDGSQLNCCYDALDGGAATVYDSIGDADGGTSSAQFLHCEYDGGNVNAL